MSQLIKFQYVHLAAENAVLLLFKACVDTKCEFSQELRRPPKHAGKWKTGIKS